MAEGPEQRTVRTVAGPLGRTRLATSVAMIVERAWPLLLPILVIGSLFLAVSWLGLFRLMPDMARLVLTVGFGLATLAALYPLRFFRRPRPEEIDRRIERANELVHTPVLAQTDQLAGTHSHFGEALWREHQRRMAAKLAGLGSDMPRARVPERDPWALRALAALLLVAAFAFSFGPLGGRVGDAFRAHAGGEAIPPRIDAWVTPPAYTRKPPIFLTASGNEPQGVITIPENSDVALRVTGGSGEEALSFTGSDGSVEDIAPNAPAAGADKPAQNQTKTAAAPLQFAGKLTADGVLALHSGGTELESWAFTVVQDKPPVIRFSGEPKRAQNGALELAYEIVDDYGAASAQAQFELADRPSPDAHPLYGPPEMPLTLPRRGSHDVTAKSNRDLTEHVWAGQGVNLTLKAVDDAGQEAQSETKTFILPERTFTKPLAKALVEQRRVLSLDANRKADVLRLMDAITLRPQDTFENLSHYLGIMAGRTRLTMASTDDQLREMADYLWQMALQIEDGALTDAERRLRQAQEALKQALENNASDEEIERLMKELRQAMNDFLREFAERAQQNPDLAQQMPPNMQELRESDLQRMLDQIENLAKSGNREQAQELLSQLQDMMNNLQAGRQQQGQNGQQNSEMRQQMNKLGEIMRRQQEMMNETFNLDQMQRGQQPGQQGQDGQRQQGQQGQGQQGRGQRGQGQQGQGMTPEEFAEAMRQLQQGQGKLQGDLESLMQGLEGLGIQPGEGFGEAGEAMGSAEGALGEQEGQRAVGEQGRALEALRRGAQNMMQQMQQAMEGDQGTGQEGGRQQQSDRDPLGRPRATTGPDFGNSVKVPDEIDVQRARQILDAIRKRLGNALSPEIERDYLERLLDMR